MVNRMLMIISTGERPIRMTASGGKKIESFRCQGEPTVNYRKSRVFEIQALASARSYNLPE